MKLDRMADLICGPSLDTKNLNLGLLLLRVVLGVAFIYHGWPKVNDIGSTISMFSSMNIGVMMTYIAAYTEFLGGVAILLGALNRLAAWLLAAFMVAAIYLVHINNGYSAMANGYEYQLLLLVGVVFLALVGPGKYSVRVMIMNKYILKNS